MKKILAAFDGYHYSESTQEYSFFIARQCNAHLVGVFLDDFTYHTYHYFDVAAAGGAYEERIDQLNRADEETRMRSVQHFEEACLQAGLQFSVHRDHNIAIQDLLQESIYADLLVIDRKEAFVSAEKELPSIFLRDLLADVQCPVLVAAPRFRPVKKLVFLYDGQPTSVYAVKMFSYTLTGFHALETDVVVVKKEKESLHVPENRLMKEFLKRHFPEAQYTVLKGDPEEEILAYLKKQEEGALVVLGAYQRSRVSRWFKKSMADHLISGIDAPLFIAHQH